MDLLASVDARTNLAGNNRLEVLKFGIGGSNTGARSVFGVNVFKVREVKTVPEITASPSTNPCVVGMFSTRGQIVPVVDLAMAVGITAHEKRDLVIIAEFNKMTVAFLVASVDIIIRLPWTDVMTPPDMISGEGGAITSVIQEDNGTLIQMIDLETVSARVLGLDLETNISGRPLNGVRIIFAEDSIPVRNYVNKELTRLGADVTSFENGQLAWNYLTSLAKSPAQIGAIDVVISDVEMPLLDGTTLAKYIKEDTRMSDIKVLLHSSMSNPSTMQLGRQVGADAYIAKDRDLTDLVHSIEKHSKKGRQITVENAANAGQRLAA